MSLSLNEQTNGHEEQEEFGEFFSVPASFAQQRLWFLDQFAPGTPLYNMPAAWRLRGPLDVQAMQRSLDEMVARHEVLRTTFADEGGEPVQIISASGSLPMPVIDLSHEPDPFARASALVQEDADRPFDLAHGPLVRAALFRLGPEDHVITINMHHIVSDLWSLGIISNEISTLYRAYSQGQESPLPELPIQYADYAVWQREYLRGEVLEEHLDFWRRYLDGAPRSIDLPTDRPRGPAQTLSGGWVGFELGAELSAALHELSRRTQATLFMTLASALSALLGRYSGQDEVCIGYPVANRNRSETEGLIGFFLNTLVLRARVSGRETFMGLLESVRESVLEADPHQELPFVKLVEELRPERDPSRQPLFQVIFTYLGVDHDDLKIPGLKVEWVPAETRTAKFDLSIFISEAEDGALSGGFEYSTDLFDHETIERLATHYKTLLAAAVADPHARLCDLPLLTEEERRQLLVDWNDTHAEFPSGKCVHELFERQAALSPDATAIVCGQRRLSYGELNERANRLAHHLRSLGVGPDTLVGLCAERSPEVVVGMLGVMKAGGAYVPLDPQYPRERISFMLEDSQVSVLLTQESLAERLPREGANIICLDSDWEKIERESPENPLVLNTLDHLAYVIYTSGSTGRPKGVEIPHRGLLNLVSWNQRLHGLSPSDRATQLAGLSFDASVLEMWPYLATGAALYIVDEEVRLSPERLVRWLADESITFCFMPTPLAEAALAEDWPRGMALKALLTGGDKLRRGIDEGHGFTLFNYYGPTESSVVATCGVVEPGREWSTPPPIGRPVANTQVYILDRMGEPVPAGVAGELHIGGAGLARGYLRRPSLTAEKFVPDPFAGEPGARLYRTGDLVRYLADGRIEFLGRVDDQVKVRGFRIELGEIETVLGAHPSVRSCAVAAVAGAGGASQLAAYVVSEPGSEMDAQALRAYLKEKLPEHMIPSAFVPLDALPLTPNGKVDRKALPAPEREKAEPEREFVAPRNQTEETLAGIWRDLLGIERVSVTDSFFDMGGHSLLATQAISRIRAAFGVELTLRTFFTNPSVAGLGEQIETLLWIARGPQLPPDGAAMQREMGEL